MRQEETAWSLSGTATEVKPREFINSPNWGCSCTFSGFGTSSAGFVLGVGTSAAVVVCNRNQLQILRLRGSIDSKTFELKQLAPSQLMR